MKTEKDIRKFVQDNKVSVPKDDAFMEGIVRQIDLLPEPSAFNTESVEESLRIVRLIKLELKKRARREALYVLLSSMAILVVFIAVFWFLPVFEECQTVGLVWKGGIPTIVYIVSFVLLMSRTDLLKI